VWNLFWKLLGLLFRYGNGMNSVITTTDKPTDGAANTDIYVIAAHPAWRESRVNRPLMEAARGLPRVQVQDLYSSYPDYAIDVPREQAALERAQLVVLLHPIQWYSMPALQKLWFDEVLTYGWAYGVVSAGSDETAPQGAPGTALRGKALWLVLTTGGQEGSYQPSGKQASDFDAFLPPYQHTAALCGMRFLPPLVLHSAHSTGKQEVLAHIAQFRQRLQHYPHWPEAAPDI